MKRAIMMAAAFGAASLSSGCAALAVGSAATAGVMMHQNRTPGQDMDDTAISAKVKAHLFAYDSSAFAHVHVEVALGEVLLAGAAPTDQDRRDAERIAGNVFGVRSVDNQIVVGPGEHLTAGAHDQWITARVRAKLVADKSIKGIDFNIETRRGVVYLMGLARSDHEAREAAEAAARVGGVTKVVSYVRVREAPYGRSYASEPGPVPMESSALAPRQTARAPDIAASMELGEGSY